MNKLAFDLGDKLFNGASHPTRQVTGLGTFVSTIVSNAIIVSGIVFIFMGLYAGYQMISAAGQRSPQNMEAAKKTLTTAFVGFLLVFGSYFIVRIIETITGTTLL